jgi:hypothetical protein
MAKRERTFDAGGYNKTPGRPVSLWRPCPCGCDNRDGSSGAGYISGATKDGKGFTVWLESEETYQAVKRVFKEQFGKDAEGDHGPGFRKPQKWTRKEANP